MPSQGGSRWAQHDDDYSRLPEGFKRIGYDADTQRYTYRDSKGVIYQGEPGAEYGTLTPIISSFEKSRPSAFASEKSRPIRSSTMPASKATAPTTFHDILPPELITSSTLSDSSSKAHSTFVEGVRKTTLPKMHGVVTNLRRSVTSMRKPKAPRPEDATRSAFSSGINEAYDPEDDDTRRLMSRDSLSASSASMSRSSSVATSRTGRSKSSVITVKPVVHS